MSKGKKIVSLLDRLFDKEVADKVKKAKDGMIDSSRVKEAVEEQTQINPQFLDELEYDDYEEIMEALPAKERASLMGEDADMYETAEMMGGFSPKEAAKDIELFGDLEELQVYASQLDADEAMEFIENVTDDNYNILGGLGGIFEIDQIADKLSPKKAAQNIELFLVDEDKLKAYTSKLDAKGTRDFIDNLPDDVYEDYDGLSEYVTPLGPRVQKAEGGLLDKPEMDSDEEMEEDYIEHVMKEVLSDEDYKYVDDALEKDDKLSVLFDEIVLSAVEFTGAGEVEGPGNGTSDSIPARLSDGEFVFTKKAVDVIGADKLQTMMKEAEAEADTREQKAKGGVMDNTQADTQSIDDEVNKYMLQANRMPSVQGR